MKKIGFIGMGNMAKAMAIGFVRSGKVAAAAMDVVSSEPMLNDNPLATAPNCIITPHIAWAGFETRDRLMNILKENVSAYLNGTPQNVVNK